VTPAARTERTTSPAPRAASRATAPRARAAAAFSAESYVEATVASAARCTLLCLDPPPAPETSAATAADPGDGRPT
jgi:hypothetical protein